MNIFLLDEDTAQNAHAHINCHVVKMRLELLQLLSTTYRMRYKNCPDFLPKSTHVNHPCRLWVGLGDIPFDYTVELGIELCKEYEFRYKKQCNLLQKFIFFSRANGRVNFGILPKPVLAMPEEYKVKCPIESYRKYYIADKVFRKDGIPMMRYKGRKPPVWLTDVYEFTEKNGEYIVKT